MADRSTLVKVQYPVLEGVFADSDSSNSSHGQNLINQQNTFKKTVENASAPLTNRTFLNSSSDHGIINTNFSSAQPFNYPAMVDVELRERHHSAASETTNIGCSYTDLFGLGKGQGFRTQEASYPHFSSSDCSFPSQYANVMDHKQQAPGNIVPVRNAPDVNSSSPVHQQLERMSDSGSATSDDSVSYEPVNKAKEVEVGNNSYSIPQKLNTVVRTNVGNMQMPGGSQPTTHFHQRHLSGPAGVSIGECRMMQNQRIPDYLFLPTLQHGIQPFSASSSKVAGVSSGESFVTFSQPGQHVRHPSEPTPRSRRPSAGKGQRSGNHHAGLSSLNVRDEHRKRQHNNIEKRRRSTINDRIHQLANMLPNCSDPEFKQHKGNILTKVVEHIKTFENLPGEIAALRLENSKVTSQNLFLQQQVAALHNFIRSKDLDPPAFSKQLSDQALIELTTTGMAKTAIRSHSPPKDNNEMSPNTPPYSRHPSGNNLPHEGHNSPSLGRNWTAQQPCSSNNRETP